MLHRWTTATLLLALGMPAALLAQDDPPTAPDNPAAAPDTPDTDTDTDDDNGLFADPEPGTGDAPPRRVEGLDLPMGETVTFDADTANFRFATDEPGMLTLLAYAPGDRTRTQLQLRNAEGELVPGGIVNGNVDPNNFGARIVVDANGNPQGTLPGLAYLTLPITEPGEYQLEVRITGDTDGESKVGASWVGFEQVAGFERQPVQPPPPPPPPPAPFDPTDVAIELAAGDTHELAIDGDRNNGWIKLTAEDDGTFAIITREDAGNVQLAAFLDGQFGNIREGANDNRNGRPGHEAMLFHARAGQTWYVRVNAPRIESVSVRTLFIYDDLEPADE